MQNENLTKAYYIYRDGSYSSIRAVMIHPEFIDNATYYKSLTEAKKELISDLQYLIKEYRECIAEIRSFKG